MRVTSVEDVPRAQLQSTSYDLAFFASGYESRCTALGKSLTRSNLGAAHVIGFEEHPHHPNRLLNDEFFQSQLGLTPKVSSGASDEVVLHTLASHYTSHADRMRILVDYSSMSRNWYATIMNWVRYCSPAQTVEIDFAYSVGQHHSDVHPRVVTSLYPLPGLDGQCFGLFGSTAFIGLGFDGLATVSVLDCLEADRVVAFYASPGAFSDYAERTQVTNREVLDERAELSLALPLFSVRQSFSYLAEVVGSYLRDGEITLVPMGPKPLVLASILVSLRFPQVCCLGVGGRFPIPDDVLHSGDTVCARITFEKQEGAGSDEGNAASGGMPYRRGYYQSRHSRENRLDRA
jgi:hypothetical protein